MKKDKVIFYLYVLFFSIGTVSHVLDIISYGFFGYTFAPFVINIYWTSLTFLDAFTVLLLFIKRNFGVMLSLAIIISDVIINISYGIYTIVTCEKFVNWDLITQIPVCIFILVTYKNLLVKNE